MTFSSSRLPKILLVLAVLAVWGKTVSFGFVWDDRYFIETNESLRSAPAADFFTKETAQHAATRWGQWGVYRPLRNLHWAALVRPFGRPISKVFHAANVAWQAAAALLFFEIVLLALVHAGARRAREAAFLAALVFAVHPASAEVVAWAKALDDLMAAVFLMTAFLAGWKAWGSRRSYAWAALSGAAYAAALLSKENAAAFLPVFLFTPVLAENRKKFFSYFVFLFLLDAAFLLARGAVLGGPFKAAAGMPDSYGQTLIDMLPVTFLYIRTFLAIPPFPTDFSYLQGGAPFLSAPVLGGAAVLALAAFAWVKCARDPKRFVAALGLTWAACALLPVSNVIPTGQFFAVRFAYLPLAGLLLAASAWIARLLERSRRAFAAVLFAATALAVVASGASEAWRSELSLMRHGYETAPPTRRSVVNYAAALDQRGDDKTLSGLIARHPDLVKDSPMIAWLEARSLIRRGDAAEGRRRVKALEEKLSGDDSFLMQLGGIEISEKNFDKARVIFETLTSRRPSWGEAWGRLGTVYAALGRTSDADAAVARSGKSG